MTAQAADTAAKLKARAALLARPLDDLQPDDAAHAIEVLEFRLAEERYAVETRFVQEVHALRDLTPLPCTPPFVLGIVNVRGQVATVIDIRRFFELPEAGLTDLHRIVLLHDAGHGSGGEVGLLADMAVAVKRIARAAVQPAMPTRTGIGAHFVQGITAEGVVVLDIARVLSDPRLVVDDEPGEGLSP